MCSYERELSFFPWFYGNCDRIGEVHFLVKIGEVGVLLTKGLLREGEWWSPDHTPTFSN